MDGTRARLNPFLFSPNTNFRFVLLVVSVLGASLFGYYHLYNQMYRQELFADLTRCLSEADAAYPTDGLEVASPEYVNQNFLNTRYYNLCAEPTEQSQSRWILLRLALLLLVAGLLYWLMPIWRLRRDRLTVFSADDDPEIMVCLLDLCKSIGLVRPPIFLLRALNASPSGLAFGRWGRYYVVLNAGLLVLFYQDLKRFQSIVLHELAHLRNKDVDKTYFSLAVGIAFVLVTLIPLFLGNLIVLFENFRGNIGFVLWQTFSLTLYLPLVYITLVSILRSREVYADARLLLLRDHQDVFRKELQILSDARRHRLEQLFGLHPDSAWRLKVFDEPDLILGLSHADAFLVGIISTFALRELDIFLSNLFPPVLENYSLLAASLFFVPFVASVVGLAIWQRLLASQIREQALSGFGRYGLSLGAGMLLGMSLSISSFYDNSLTIQSSGLGNALLYNVFLGVVFLLSMFFIFRWVSMGAAVWLETVSGPKSLRAVTSFGLLVTGVFMSVWVGLFYLLYKFGLDIVILLAPALQTSDFEGLGLSVLSQSIVSLLIWLPILLTLPMLLFMVVWAFPLLSSFRRSRSSVKDLFIEEHQASYLTARAHSQIRPFSAFLWGLMAALGFLVLVIVVRVLLHLLVEEETRVAIPWLFNYRIFHIGLAILLQVLLAIILSGTIKSLGWAHGFFAALVAGVTISFGLATVVELGDCISVLRLGQPSACLNFFEGGLGVWLGPILVVGWLFCLLPAFAASWFGEFLRSRRLAARPAHP